MSGEVERNVQGINGEIISDMTTSFTILLAIFFPSVTGKAIHSDSRYFLIDD